VQQNDRSLSITSAAAATCRSRPTWQFATVALPKSASQPAAHAVGVAAGVKLAHVAGAKQLRYRRGGPFYCFRCRDGGEKHGVIDPWAASSCSVRHKGIETARDIK
jgi:hypothetical protein